MRGIFYLLLSGLAVARPTRAGDEMSSAIFSIRGGETTGQLVVTYSGRPICVYTFRSNQFKPYVKELRTLAGENVLLDSPPDHLHHHGLMYAVRVNGVNFWEEVEPAGKEKHVAIIAESKCANGASFSELIHWIAPDSGPEPLLIENREITLSVDESQKEVALLWKSKFQVGAHVVKLTGTAYNGLGMRFPQAWNGTAAHRNSEDFPYTVEHKWDVTPARWAALYHDAEGSKSTVALFSNSRNAGDRRFFSMNNPFAYLSVTQNLEHRPIEYDAGKEFELDYLVLLYSEPKPCSFLNDRYDQWLKQRSLK
jgi:hypothetical protein